MAIEYNLRFSNSNINEDFITKIFREQSIDTVGINDLKMGFEIYKFNPKVYFELTYIKNKDYATGHPSNNYETIFKNEDFYFNEFISYRLEKNLHEEKESFQFEKFIKNVFKLTDSLNREVLFTGSGGNELFIYSDKIFHIVPTFYKTLKASFSYILEEYTCKLFVID